MGKRIIQQRRGRGSPTYNVKKKAYRYAIKYPNKDGKGKVVELINSPAHSAPLARIKIGDIDFLNPAFNGMSEGDEVKIGEGEAEEGNILRLKNIPVGSRVYNVESRANDGGKLIRSSGNSAVITKKGKGRVAIMMPSKKEKWLNEDCRATIGRIAGHGRLEKPIIKAGKKHKMMRAKGRLWPRTSAVCMNAVDHPLGSGRGKNPSHGRKGKTPKLNAPAGAKVGSLRPKRTGRKKK